MLYYHNKKSSLLGVDFLFQNSSSCCPPHFGVSGLRPLKISMFPNCLSVIVIMQMFPSLGNIFLTRCTWTVAFCALAHHSAVVLKQAFHQALRDGDLLVVKYHHSQILDGKGASLLLVAIVARQPQHHLSIFHAQIGRVAKV